MDHARIASPEGRDDEDDPRRAISGSAARTIRFGFGPFAASPAMVNLRNILPELPPCA